LGNRSKTGQGTAADSMDSAAEIPLERRTERHRTFLVITLLLPFILLAGTELALRAVGVGALESLFIPVPSDSDYLQPNPKAIERFFPDPGQAPDVSIDTTWFPEVKAPGTLRVFLQGASTAAGFPYGRWASPAALLQQRLQRAYPDRNIEVINTSMAAVSSYVLLDFVDEIIARQPDAVVVYAGHNEYLGIGGVASSLVSARSPVLARFVARLRRLHLYRGLERALGQLWPGGGEPVRREGTLMAAAAAESSIALGSKIYQRGIHQFEGNLRRLLSRYERAGIPVFIGTLASNVRDQPPFVDTTAADGGDSASEVYRRARQSESEGRRELAREQYLMAKDLDGLRFRAPESFNGIIRKLAGREGAVLIDSQAALAVASQGGLIGDELMLEHVHPNVGGYFRLASAFYPAFARWLGEPPVRVDDAMARREIPVTEVDRLNGEYRVAVLKNDWPFVPERRPTSLPAPSNRIEEIAQSWFQGQLNWAQAMNEAMSAYQQAGNVTEAARVAANVAEAFINADDAQFAAGRLLLRSEQPQRALHYLKRAVRLNGEPIPYRLSLAQAYYQSGQVEESIATLEATLAEHPGEQRATFWLEKLTAGATSP